MCATRTDMSPAGVTLRRASLDDAADLVALVESAYRGEGSRRGWTTEADLLEGQRTDVAEVTDVVTSAHAMMLMAEQKAEVGSTAHLLGCCAVEARADRVAHFGMFAVRPGLQGRGTGRLLLRQAEHLARTSMGAEAMHMTVIRQRPELISWYERLGYARTGERVPFPYGNERHGLPTVPDLEFVVLARSLTLAEPTPAPQAPPAVAR